MDINQTRSSARREAAEILGLREIFEEFQQAEEVRLASLLERAEALQEQLAETDRLRRHWAWARAAAVAALAQLQAGRPPARVRYELRQRLRARPAQR